jgi:hypothetical protein
MMISGKQKFWMRFLLVYITSAMIVYYRAVEVLQEGHYGEDIKVMFAASTLVPGVNTIAAVMYIIAKFFTFASGILFG